MADNLWKSYKNVVFWPAKLNLTDWKINTSKLERGNWALITPDNAKGENLLESVNKQQRDNFRVFLKQQKLAAVEFYGGDRLKQHKELTIALNIDEARALEIGRAFKQKAIYTIVDGNLILIACNSSQRDKLGHISQFILTLDKY